MGKPTKKGRFTLPIALLTAGSLIVLPLAGCQPGGAPLGAGWFGGANKQSQATPNAQPQAYTGKIDLQFDPGLLGQQYQGLRKVPFSGGDFQIQKQGGGPPVRNTGVKPRLDCVTHHSDGSYTAYFGYEHTGAEPVTIPIGPTNQLVGPNNDPQWTDPRDRGQPTTFTPGNTPAYPDSAFAVDFSNGTLTWLLDGQQVKANKHSMPQCSGTPGPSPTPSPTPSPDPSASPTPVPSPTPEPTPTPQEVVFDPADPSSLGDLYPSVPGNNPEAVVPETFEAAFSLNEQGITPLQNGILSIQTDASRLQTILNTYQAEVLSSFEEENYHWIKVDMTRIDLSQLESNLRILNARATNPDFVVSQASFGNLESARTFALLVELLAQELVDSSQFNVIHDSAEMSVQTQEGPVGDGLSAQHSWWLNENSTRVNEAWEYSMGYNVDENRPVNIAVIDTGFAGLWYESSAKPDGDISSHQLDWQNGFLIFRVNDIYPALLHGKAWTEMNSTTSYPYHRSEDFPCRPSSVCNNRIWGLPNTHGT